MLIFIIVFISNPSYFWDEDDQQFFVGFWYRNMIVFLLEKWIHIFSLVSLKINLYDEIPKNTNIKGGSKKYLFRMNIQVCKGRKRVQKRIKNQMIVLDFQQCLKKSFLRFERTAIPVFFKCESRKQHCYRNVNSITSYGDRIKDDSFL